jgi:hypothetical protein
METSEFYQTVFPNNTKNNFNDSNTNFSFKFPHPVNLGTAYEVAIHEAFIPYNVFNCPNNEYLQIEMYASDRQINVYDSIPAGKKKLGKPTKAEQFKKWRDIEKIVPVETEVYDEEMKGYRSEMVNYKLHYAVRVKLEAGFYKNIGDLIELLKIKIRYMCENVKKFEIAVPELSIDDESVKYQTHYLKYIDGWVGQQNEWYTGFRKDIISDTFLDRIKYISAQKKLHVQPEEKHSETVIILKLEEATSKLFGWPLRQNITFYPNQMFESPNQCRLSPFGELILVYSNIIENPVVKGFSHNLLKVLCLSSNAIEFGQIFNYEYKNPAYTPLNIRHLNSMDIYLRDLTGSKILFENSAQPVMFTLHFRPILNPMTI